jgi:lysophospholipase L1-like esterase
MTALESRITVGKQLLMIKKVSLAVGATLVCLLVAEIVVRVMGIAPGVTRLRIDLPHGSFQSSPNPLLRYEPRPGSPGVNAYGIRDRDYPVAKPTGTIRILVVGDSVGYGFCNDEESLRLEDLFMKRLERKLNEASAAPVEVINLCVSGYDTVQEIEFLEQKGLPLDPDLVLVAYCLNDDFDASMELNYFRQHPQFGVNNEIGRRLFLGSHLVRLFWLRNWKPGPPRPERPAQGELSRTERGFRRLAELASEQGFQPLIVVFPLFEPLETYRWHRSHTRAAHVARKFGLPVLDLLQPFSKISGGNLKKLQGRCNREHPDESGHEVAAAAIQEHIWKSRLLRLPSSE